MGRPEDKYVKIPALVHATRIEYSYASIHGKEPGVDYDGDTHIFYEAFRTSISRINGRDIDEQRARYLAEQLRLKLSADGLGEAFFTCLQTGIEGYRLLDFENPENNSFQVVTELPCENGEDSFRPDITFLVNGMPLAFMEVKRQNNKDDIQSERERMFRRFSNPVIVSAPYANPKLVESLMPDIAGAIARGIEVRITLRKPKSEKSLALQSCIVETLSKVGCKVVVSNAPLTGIAIFDGKITWYGTLPLLAFAKADDCSLRVEGAEVAADLEKALEASIAT